MGTRRLLGSLLAAIVLMVWGFLSWALFADELGFVKVLPHEAAVTEALRGHVSEEGAYFFPIDGFQGSAVEKASWSERHTRGPLGLLLYRAEGTPPSPWRSLLGLAHFFLGALLASALVSMAACGSYLRRVKLVTLAGLFATLVVQGGYSVWWYAPWGFTVYHLVVTTFGWFLAGLVLARFVTPDV